MTFAAVVVSYNRREFLVACLEALTQQTQPLDEIIVVDNGSTDGSVDYVRDHHPEVTLFCTGENLGGAGGFAWGVEIALARGHDAVWLMDDDAEPERDAFAPLVRLWDDLDPAPAFLASLVTAGRDRFNRRNPPVIEGDAQKQVEAHAAGAIAVESATFVGVLINLREASTTHLPMSDYFIWLDDLEYTRRLSARGLGLAVPSSMVNHPDNKPVSSDMGARLYYYVRNSLWTMREHPRSLGGNVLTVYALVRHALSQFSVADNKAVWTRGFVTGLLHGFGRRPQRQAPGSLLATLDPAVRAGIGC